MTPLKLQHLDISGFKSFVDPVDLAFAGGLTAIVGPNGCGKSNISDAITWVLGEQSAKNLRGGTMEDVIFAGAEGRKPLGMAEVTLHLKTDPAFPHSDDGQLSIGRRVFRTGESRYMINGRTVRLKEIKDLLMDTGLGIRAYSVIEQGRVGMILSGKPAERRKLLEEAAGITRYKQRKRIAEVKLEEATANLMRLDDVIGEVERSLRSLKRQASAARRFTKKQGEVRELLEQVLTGRFVVARDRLAVVAEKLTTAQDREAALAGEVARGEGELATARERLDELAEELSARHQRHSDLAATIEGRQQFLKASRERLGEIGERSRQSRDLAKRRRGEIDEQRRRLEERAGQRGELETEFESASRDVDRDTAEISAADERLSGAERAVEAVRQRLLAAIGELNTLRNRRHQGQIELEKGNYRRHHLAEELTEKEGALAQAKRSDEETAARVEEMEGRLAEGNEQLTAVKASLEATMQREKEAQTEQRALDERRAEAERRKKLLTELGRAFAERRDRLREALAGIESGDGSEASSGVGFLADRLRAVEGWERSLDFYLADLEHALVVDGGGSDAALDLARALAAGPGATVVGELPASTERPALLDDPAVVLSLGEALGLPDALAAALPPAFLVEDPADAARLARENPGASFISRQGLWAAGGAVHAEAGEAVPGVLERERELSELEEEIPRLETQLDEVAALLDKLVERRAATAREANALEGSQNKLRQELAVATARREDAAARHRRLGVERETVADELAELDRELARIGGSHDQLAAELAEAERRHAALEKEQESATEALDAARAERQQKKEASADRRGRRDLLRERLEQHDRELARLGQEIENGERQVTEWEREEQRLLGRRGDLEGEIETAEKELQAALERRDVTADEVTAASEQVEAQRQTI
ncbi:MAG TPA: AAA family ATPase, partial [Thermoanaerobaculia bacterium]|nr:AAA family ATPase [Thermoanaerobaculia bacterium]